MSDLREWPGIPVKGRRHGEPAEFDETGDPFRYCEACGACHHPRSRHCNGLRDPSDERCPAVLGEVQCHRPADHSGEHKARSQVLAIDWRELTDARISRVSDGG